ncbi:MAG: aspartyl/asparaginyl beta-hydroxylase domain-containing protein [Bacteroidia bacterium]
MRTQLSNDYLHLPVKTNKQKLHDDLKICLNTQWKEHFNQNDYSGSWTVIALRSQTGSAQDILAHNSGLPFNDTSLMSVCGYFKEIIDNMQFEKETVRLLRLQPGSIVKEHRDMGLAYRFGCFRLHIPIVTDASVLFTVGGENIVMEQGECWYADFDLPHSVYNKSDKERIHLVIDGKRNAWTDELFAIAGYNFEEEKRQQDYSFETKMQMIDHLRLLKTPAANEIIKKLENEMSNKYNPK